MGGLATSGLVTLYLPLCDGNGKQVTFGIAEELLRLSVKCGQEGINCRCWLESGSLEERRSNRFQTHFNPQIFAVLVEQLLLQEGVEILYGSVFCATQTKNHRITHIILENKSGRQAYAVKNVVDASGDSDVCRFAGEGTIIFGQGNIPAAWYYAVENGRYVLHALGAADIPDSQKTDKQIESDKKELRYIGLDADELTKLEIYSHQWMMQDFLKNGQEAAEHALATMATTPQLRMTRRIDGVYTMDDNESHMHFSDSVGLFADWRKKGTVYELPFSTLYGKTISNLITAGRCISVTDAMWDVTRVIPVCAVSGEAAGTAAAITDCFADISIDTLQKTLVANGVKLHE